MNLILSRHGNTFGPDDPVVWTGSGNDIPLVARGIEQAEAFAKVLRVNHVEPVAVFCGPLQRTFRYSEIIIRELGLSLKPQVDPRLNEIDYGEWTGLTQVEVVKRFGAEDLRDWDEHSVWPSQGHWGGSESEVIQEVQSFSRDLVHKWGEHDTVLVVSSNGRLRFFLSLIEGELEKRKKLGTFKVKTGHICKVVYSGSRFSTEYWNQEPGVGFRI